MHFVDQVDVLVVAGEGGDGAIAFRKEMFVPFGGPAGGNGGDGGDIIFETDPGLGTLLDFRYKAKITAKDGENGRGKDQYGKGAEDVRVRVPVGTQIFDQESGKLISDLTEPYQSLVVAKGGKGGRGNMHFATPFDRAPKRAEPGEPGERKQLRLVLKLIADVGILGFPNVGKSTFISVVSRAKPKIADYPFTTLVPNLGVASHGTTSNGDQRSFVIADIPGLIEGASSGAGLGTRFLRHVERCKVLLHVITPTLSQHSEDQEGLIDPKEAFAILMEELKTFDPELAKRPMVVALSKTDLPHVKEMVPDLKKYFSKKKIKLIPFSAATHEGVQDVLGALADIVYPEES